MIDWQRAVGKLLKSSLLGMLMKTVEIGKNLDMRSPSIFPRLFKKNN
jgi:hypothetical protein